MNLAIKELVKDQEQQVIKWRRKFHQNPELSFQEENTSQFIFETLNSFGNLVVSKPTKTSVMARLIGKFPGKTLALRADIDALPINELNTCEYKSTNMGVMHACGHDGHTASLLGVAKIISQMADQVHGEIRLLFQHAEELPPGGAKQMIDAGVMEGVDLIVGIHLWTIMQFGRIGIISGAMMAAADIFHLEIIGKGGHGAAPHRSVDSILTAAHVVTNLQQIVARNVDPLEPAVISVTKFVAGSNHNVLPSTVSISGTVRTLNPELSAQMPTSIERVISGVTAAHNAQYKLDYIRGYAPLINDAQVANLIEQVVVEELGPEWVDKMKPSMGGEDFSAYLDYAPGCFIFVGASNEQKGIIHPHHHPNFDIDEDALAVSMQIFLGVINKVCLLNN